MYVKDLRILSILDLLIKKFSIKIYFRKIWENLYPILHEREGGNRPSYTSADDGNSFCNKNFQIPELMMKVKIVITLHVYLFLRQLIKIAPLSWPYSGKKLKSSMKTAKADFSIAKAKHGDSCKTYENLSWLGMRNGAYIYCKLCSWWYFGLAHRNS